jgi:hypothetical protein
VPGRFGTLGRPEATPGKRGSPARAKPEATPETIRAERAQNRHGGAPRGAVPVARDGPRFANVVSRCYGRDGIRIPPPGAPPSPRSGVRKLRRKEEPGRECPGNEETADTNFVGWVERRARNPSNPVPQGAGDGCRCRSTHPTEKRERRERTRVQQRAAGTKKTALFDIVNRKGADGVLLTAVDRISGNALVSRPSARLGAPFCTRCRFAREPGPRAIRRAVGLQHWVPGLAALARDTRAEPFRHETRGRGVPMTGRLD